MLTICFYWQQHERFDRHFSESEHALLFVVSLAWEDFSSQQSLHWWVENTRGSPFLKDVGTEAVFVRPNLRLVRFYHKCDWASSYVGRQHIITLLWYNKIAHNTDCSRSASKHKYFERKLPGFIHYSSWLFELQQMLGPNQLLRYKPQFSSEGHLRVFVRKLPSVKVNVRQEQKRSTSYSYCNTER